MAAVQWPQDMSGTLNFTLGPFVSVLGPKMEASGGGRSSRTGGDRGKTRQAP
jgi:hypothetical protein